MTVKNRRKAAKVLSLMVFAAGIAVIIGWVFDIGILKSICPSWISMKFTTAIAFALSGISLYFIARSFEGEFDKAQVVLSVTSLIIVLLMGILFLSALMDIRTGAEDLFIREAPGTPKSVVPGRPSIPTMAAFLLVAAAGIITILHPKRLAIKLRIIGAAVALIGATAVSGYITSKPLLYYYVENVNSAMALHTAILFILLGTGLICLSD